MELVKGLSGEMGRPLGLDDAAWEGLKSIGQTCSLRDGATLFTAGEEFYSVFLIRTGTVALRRENTVFDLAESPEIIGGPLALRSAPPTSYPISAEALGPTTTLRIPVNKFADFTKKNPVMAELIQGQLQQRVQFLQNCRLAQMRPVPERLARIFLLRPVALSSGHVTRKVMAQIAGTTTESVIRVISHWRRNGVLAVRGRRYEIVNPEAFAKYGNSDGNVPADEPG